MNIKEFKEIISKTPKLRLVSVKQHCDPTRGTKVSGVEVQHIFIGVICEVVLYTTKYFGIKTPDNRMRYIKWPLRGQLDVQPNGFILGPPAKRTEFEYVAD